MKSSNFNAKDNLTRAAGCQDHQRTSLLGNKTAEALAGSGKLHRRGQDQLVRRLRRLLRLPTGIVNGVGDGKFDPNRSSSPVYQFAKMLLGALGL